MTLACQMLSQQSPVAFLFNKTGIVVKELLETQIQRGKIGSCVVFEYNKCNAAGNRVMFIN